MGSAKYSAPLFIYLLLENLPPPSASFLTISTSTLPFHLVPSQHFLLTFFTPAWCPSCHLDMLYL